MSEAFSEGAIIFGSVLFSKLHEPLEVNLISCENLNRYPIGEFFWHKSIRE